jgi:hypothetical protein
MIITKGIKFEEVWSDNLFFERENTSGEKTYFGSLERSTAELDFF